MKTDANIDEAVLKNKQTNYRDSDHGYKAVMIKKQEKFLTLTKKFNFAYDDNKETIPTESSYLCQDCY